MILGPGDRFLKVPVIYGPVKLPGPLSGPKLRFLKNPSTFSVLTRPKKIVGRYQTLVRALHGRLREKKNELEPLFRSNHSLCVSGLFFLRFDSKDNAIRSKFNFEVVIV